MDLWNTYDTVRPLLMTQCKPEGYNPDTGLDIPELEKLVADYIAAHEQNEPRIILRANMFRILLENGRLRVDPFDWFADHIATGRIMWKYQAKWHSEEGRRRVPPSARAANPIGFPNLDLSHTSPSWKNILKYGISGLMKRAEEALKTAKDQEAKDFYTAVVIAYKAIRSYMIRLADESERVHSVRTTDVLRRLIDNPPATFHEALQLSFIYNQMQEIEGEYVRSQGTFDQLYIDFYRNDIATGRLTRDQAKELIKFFFDKFYSQHFGAGNNICFGGRRPDGTDLCNELTELAFEAFAERGDIDPKLSFRIHKNTPPNILRQAAECVKAGTNAIVFANDDIAYPMFVKHGKVAEDVVDFVPIGCYEPAIMGKELSCTMSATYNLAKLPEYVMAELEEAPDFQTVIDFTKRLMKETLDETLERARIWETAWPTVNPAPVLSGTMDSCIEKGRDVSNSGTKYSTSGVMCAGIGTLADSIAAIQYLVFQQHLCTWAELRAIIAANWEGHEHLREIARKRAPKWGNNHSAADEIGVDLAMTAARIINNTPNTRGGHFQMGCWSIDYTHTFGKQTKATPDGRKDFDLISKNLGATIAADRNGVTALIASAAKFDHTEFPDGSVLDIALHPSALQGRDGAEVIMGLIRTFFDAGGFYCHFNIFDANTLRNAQANPEKYANLQVRVCGWNTKFVDLSKSMQDAFIAQAEAL